MKRVTAAAAIALSLGANAPADAQVPNRQFQTPLNYRFSVMPRSHVFSYNRQRPPHGSRHRHHAHYLPALAGPAVIYQNGEVGIPPSAAPAVPAFAQPVVYRIGETGCGLQQVVVEGSRGRTGVNIWRC